MDYPLKMVIFYSYVKLPEGIFLEFAFETPSPQPGSTRGDGSHVPEGTLGEDQSTGRAWEAWWKIGPGGTQQFFFFVGGRG